MPVTVGDIVNALEALGGEAHYSEITNHIMKAAQGPFPADPQASVRARLQERCSDYKAYQRQVDLFESDHGTGIWRFRKWPTPEPSVSAFDEQRDTYEALEGTLVPRTHLARERNPTLIAKFKASLPDPRCETCSMSFNEVYGELGADYIEAHHKTPVALMEDGATTTLADLAALCPNCHRIIHKHYPMSVEQLALILSIPGSFVGDMDATRKTRKTWREAVYAAIIRLVSKRQSAQFSRKEIIESELAAIIDEVDSKGETPEQTLSRALQELRRADIIEFLDDQGSYQLKQLF